MAEQKKTTKVKRKPRTKKQPEAPKKGNRIAALRAEMNKKYKKAGRVRMASEYVCAHMLRRIPSGLPSLDVAMAGGLPAGSFVEIVGAEGTGKTELATVYLARQQEIWGEEFAAAAVMSEFHYDKYYAKRRGLKLCLHPKEIEALERAADEKFNKEELAMLTEQVGHFEEAFSPIAETLWEMVIDFIDSREFNVILIDSLGSLMPKAEADSDMDDKHYSGAAPVNTLFFHKFHAAMGIETEINGVDVPNMSLILGINQVRDKIGAALFDKDPKIAGGHAKDHGKSVCLLLVPGGQVGHKIKVGGKDKFIREGKTVHWKIVKGKHGFPEGATGTLRHMYKCGFDRAYDILIEGMKLGLIEVRGSNYYYGEEKIGLGKETVCDNLRADPEFMDKLYAEILEEHGVHCNFR